MKKKTKKLLLQKVTVKKLTHDEKVAQGGASIYCTLRDCTLRCIILPDW
jgi:hypothetical protein